MHGFSLNTKKKAILVSELCGAKVFRAIHMLVTDADLSVSIFCIADLINPRCIAEKNHTS